MAYGALSGRPKVTTHSAMAKRAAESSGGAPRPTFLAMTPPTAGPTTNPLPTAAPSKDMGRMRAPGRVQSATAARETARLCLSSPMGTREASSSHRPG